MRSEDKINIFWITLFSIAMAYLESAVVVYLRAIYYPEGFGFPMVAISNHHIVTEIGREAATLIMLIGIGVLAGKTSWQKFAVFLYSFAVWDIFYYVFLKLLLGWPESLFTWDILFLIPVTWVGPVLAPVISALTMILLSLVIIYRKYFDKSSIERKVLWFLVSGSIIEIIAFVWDYCRYLFKNEVLHQIFNYSAISQMSFKYIPESFPWGIFLIGEGVIIYGIVLLYKSYFRNNQ